MARSEKDNRLPRSEPGEVFERGGAVPKEAPEPAKLTAEPPAPPKDAEE